MSQPDNFNEEKHFGEFRRKVKAAEVLSASHGALAVIASLHGKSERCDAKWARAQVGL